MRRFVPRAVYEGNVPESGSAVTATLYAPETQGTPEEKFDTYVFFFQAVRRDKEGHLQIQHVVARPTSYLKFSIHGDVVKLPKLGDTGVLPLSWAQAASWESAFDSEGSYLFCRWGDRIVYQSHHGHEGDAFALLQVAVGGKESVSLQQSGRSVVTKNKQRIDLTLQPGDQVHWTEIGDYSLSWHR